MGQLKYVCMILNNCNTKQNICHFSSVCKYENASIFSIVVGALEAVVYKEPFWSVLFWSIDATGLVQVMHTAS